MEKWNNYMIARSEKFNRLKQGTPRFNDDVYYHGIERFLPLSTCTFFIVFLDFSSL